MTHTRLWASSGIIAIVIIFGFMLSVPHAREVTPIAPVAESVVPVPPPELTLRDSYKKGVHTISGSFLAPNACASVSAEASPLGDASTTIGIALAVTVATSSGVCLQLPTSADFSTTLEAPANLPITATVNGVAASTTES